jgi:hypothetical protein
LYGGYTPGHDGKALPRSIYVLWHLVQARNAVSASQALNAEATAM